MKSLEKNGESNRPYSTYMYKRKSSTASTSQSRNKGGHSHDHSEYRSTDPSQSKLTRNLSSEEIKNMKIG